MTSARSAYEGMKWNASELFSVRAQEWRDFVGLQELSGRPSHPSLSLS